MKTRHALVTLALLALLVVATWGAYRLGERQGAGPAAAPPAAAPAVDPDHWSIPQGEEATRRHIRDGLKAGDTDPATGRAVLYYHDPMVPGKKFDAPAKSPFMDMMLVPVYAGGGGSDPSTVTVSPRIRQNLGVRTAEVQRGSLSPQVEAVGSIAWNERDQALLQARATGFVEQLHVRATLDRVTAGQTLLELYVPAWVAAQEEFLALRGMRGEGLALLVDAARARMRQAGMDEAQIGRVEASGSLQPRARIVAPLAGVVTELKVREGMTVMAGDTLLRINGSATVWAEAEVPESQAALLRPGVGVRATSPALPGRSFEGRVQALLPAVDPATRTMKARLELANPGARLVPGMFVRMQFIGLRGASALLLPTEAVIQTGRRTLVMVAEDGGAFRPVDIRIGLESEGRTEVLEGLRAGQRVVISSQFLIDSEASLKGVETRSSPIDAAADAVHRTEAVIEAVQPDLLTLTHPPIASLKWPEMTMDFKRPAADRARLAPRERVVIEFRMQDGEVPQITRLRKLEAGAAR